MERRAAVGRRDQLPTDALRGVHVLVVDDDGDSRILLKTVLEYCGALVTVVASAEQAMRTLRRVTPDILVADIAMPRRDGYWLIQQVRALPRDQGSGMPAVAITAHGDEHGPQRTLAAGFDSHVRKPIDPWELCHALSALVRRT
jgi:CheY-like chemotaxis protein